MLNYQRVMVGSRYTESVAVATGACERRFWHGKHYVAETAAVNETESLP